MGWAPLGRRSRQSCGARWRGESAWESNPPAKFATPLARFEDGDSHRATSALATTVRAHAPGVKSPDAWWPDAGAWARQGHVACRGNHTRSPACPVTMAVCPRHSPPCGVATCADAHTVYVLSPADGTVALACGRHGASTAGSGDAAHGHHAVGAMRKSTRATSCRHRCPSCSCSACCDDGLAAASPWQDGSAESVRR